MQNRDNIKNIKLVAVLLMIGVAVAGHTQGSQGATQEQSARLFEFAGMSMPFEKRIGVDDGAAFVVHFSGDSRGSLDTCG